MMRSCAINRREFGVAVAGGLAASAVVPCGCAPGRSDGDLQAIHRHRRAVQSRIDERSWPPRGPLSQKQRDAIARSGITAINVTVSADTFDATTRTIALWTGEVDRYPTLISIVAARRYRPGEEGQHAGVDPRLPEHRDAGAGPFAPRCFPPAGRPDHPTHLQRPQHRRRWLPRGRRRGPERVRTAGGGEDERPRNCRGPESLRHPNHRRWHRRFEDPTPHHA